VLGVDFSNKSRNLQIGNYLQTLRLEQELTLEQLSILSQVPIDHLASIEEGRFSRFDDFYLKLYLKRFTGSLDVDLEQLYTYASQQPLPDLDEHGSSNQSERQMTEMQANISATPKNVAKTNPQRRKPTLKTANIASLEAKKKIIKFVTGLIFIVLITLIVIFIVTIISDLADRDPSEDETLPSIVENPHDVTETNGDNAEEPETEPETEPVTEPEPVPEDETSIEMDSHVGDVQTFTVITSHDEIVLRIDHSGDNWIDYPFNRIFSAEDEFEETMEPNAEGAIILPVGAVNSMDAMFINDVEVEFASGNGRQRFIFYIEFE